MFRGRRRFTRRRWGKPVQRQRTAWSPSVFADFPINMDTTLSEFVLFDPAVSDPTVETINNITTRIRRVILKGGIVVLPENSPTPLIIMSSLHVALYVVDADETDASIITTAAGSLISAHRVLWRDAKPYIASQMSFPNAAGAGGQDQFLMYRVDIDQKINVKLQPEELLVIGFQFSTSVAGVMDNNPEFAAQGAVLFDPN